MTEGIAAECGRPMARMLEHLLAPGAERLYALEGGVQVVHVKIEMHRRPMALEPAPIDGAGRGLGTGRLLEKAQLDIEAVQYGDARGRLGFHGESERGAIEGDTFGKSRYVDADG
jgi:hypothetical protein